MSYRFSEEAQKVLINAKKEMINLKHPYVGSEHFLLSILKIKHMEITKKLNSMGCTYDLFKKELINAIGVGIDTNNYFLYTPLLKRIIQNSIINVEDKDEKEITVENLFTSMLEEGEGVAIRILLSMSIDLDSLYIEFSDKLLKKGKSKKKLLVYEFGIDLNQKVLDNELDPVIGRDEEINRLIEILLRRTKNNPILLGDAGVGKTAIVEELSRRLVNGTVPSKLKGKKIISISMASLVAGTKYRGEFEERVNKILKEVESDEELIIFIDEIHTLVGAGGAEGAIDASNILKPALARNKLRVIGATTTEEYKKFILEDKALERRFQPIEIDEPNRDKTYQILEKLKPIYEAYHHVKITNETLNFIVDMSDKYIYNRKQPDKSIDVLDEVCARVSVANDKKSNLLDQLLQKKQLIMSEKNNYVISHNFDKAIGLKKEEVVIDNKINTILFKKSNKVKKVTDEMVAQVIKDKTKIPIYETNQESISKINLIEKKLKSQVIGQDNVIHEIIKVTKKIKFCLKLDCNPYSFLFVGATGVGKTFLAKEYAKLLGYDLIRLDMSEFKEEHTISKILGSPPGYVGYNDNKNILEEVKNNPYAIILLDEIEKANSGILNLFLQILDEGKIKDSRGNIVRFDNNIIIMTSNLGFSQNNLGFSKGNDDFIHSKLKEALGTEFINRIKEVLIFNKMNEKVIKKIVIKRIKDIEAVLKIKNINVDISSHLINEIIKKSNYEIFGARKIEKLVSEEIDKKVLNNIVDKNVKQKA